MFYDTILLKSQHRGHFGKAWLAATVGINKIKKEELEQMDICKLCEHLSNYIVSQSTSPRKRFSLRLSALLLNGTIKIFKAKVLILEAQVVRTLQLIHIPPGSRTIASEPRRRSHVGERLTPIPKVKKGKKNVVITPISEVPEEISFPQLTEPIQLPDVQDILAPLAASSDLITIRDSAPRKPVEEEEDNFGLQAAQTSDVLRELGMVAVPRSQRKPISSASSEQPEPVVIQVEAMVHQAKDPPSVEKLISKDSTKVQVPAQPEIYDIVPAEQAPEIEIPSVLREIQPEEILARRVIERVRSSGKKDEPSEKPERSAKKTLPKNKVFVGGMERRFIQINRCKENTGKFVYMSTPHFETAKMRENPNLKMLLMPDDEDYSQPRFGSLQASSDSFGQRASIGRLPDVMRGKSSPKETSDHTLLFRPRHSSFETSHPLSSMQIDIEPLQESRDLSIAPPLFDKPIEQPPSISEEVPQIRIQDLGLDVSLPLTPDQIPIREHEVSLPILTETSKAPVTSTPKPRRDSEKSEYKERRQRIVKIVTEWNFDSNILTLEDIAEKPLNRLSAARAFYDLLVLAASRYLILIPECDSLELKCIKKGPKCV